MGLFAAIVIFILLTIIFIIVILVAVFITTRRRINDPYNKCDTNDDCLRGYTCVREENGQGICLGIAGTFCSSNSQCQPGLVCSFTGGTGVCMADVQTPIPPVVNRPVNNQRFVGNRQPVTNQPVTKQINTVTLAQPLVINNQGDAITTQPNAIIRRPILQSMVELASSTDDEINSVGRTIDGPFDLRSQPSTNSSPRYSYTQQNVSTPCEELEGTYYCRSNGNERLGEEISAIEHSAVIDVCSYSSATVHLLANNTVICENENGRWKATNNVKITKMVSYNGYIYGLSETRCLYNLPGDCFTKLEWLWGIVDWAPYNIMHICTTLDSKALWIQCNDDRGFLHSSFGVSLHKPTDIKRIYGRDTDHYLDINVNTHTATLYPGATKVYNVYDAALTYYNDVMAIAPDEQALYRGITIVDWKPYYIRR